MKSKAKLFAASVFVFLTLPSALYLLCFYENLPMELMVEEHLLKHPGEVGFYADGGLRSMCCKLLMQDEDFIPDAAALQLEYFKKMHPEVFKFPTRKAHLKSKPARIPSCQYEHSNSDRDLDVNHR